MSCIKRFTAYTATMLLGISLTATVQAQTKQSVTNQTVTTDDGKTVLLKSNGTWQYVNKKPTNTKDKGTLSIETGLVFKSGDSKPVSRTAFYLLDKSFPQILIDGRIKNTEGEIIQDKTNAYVNFIFGNSMKINSRDDQPLYLDFYDRAWSSIKPHVLQSVVTGFDGKAVFKPMPTGHYYIMGYYEVSKNKVFWDVEFNISSGDNHLTLDQNNSGPRP